MISVELSVEDERWSALGDIEALARRAVEAALAVSPAPGDLEVSLLFADDAAMRELNRHWRDKDRPTNVLSFPAEAPPGLPGPRPLGDVILAYETVAREAEEEGKALAAHAAHLVVHGVLHLAGHDHETDEEAEAMEALEIEALARLGLVNPYRDVAA